MTDDGYFFVSRLKKNAVTRNICSFKLPKDSSVIQDDMVYMGTTQNRVENVFRLIEVNDTKGNTLRLITNRFVQIRNIDVTLVLIAYFYQMDRTTLVCH